MADCGISIPTFEVHRLRGSTLPGAVPPAFQPTLVPASSPKVLPQSVETGISMITARLAPLIKREHIIQRRIEMLELHRLLPDEVRRLDRIADRMTRRIDRWTRRLLLHKPVDARLNAIKADAYVEMTISGWTGGRGELGEDLAMSVAQSAIALGLEQACLPTIPGGNFGVYHAEILRLHGQIEAEPDDDAANQLSNRCAEIDRMVLADRPRNVADAAAALMYAKREHFQYAIEVREQTGGKPDPSARLIQHLLEGAVAALTQPVANDSDLLSLIAQHQAAAAEVEALDEASLEPVRLYHEGKPKRPAALYWSTSDRARPAGRVRVPGSDSSWYYVYDDKDVGRLRGRPAVRIVEHRSPADWNPEDTIVRRERVPDEQGETRRQEILAAWDAWQAEDAALKESTGLNAANALVDAASEACNAIEDAILETAPRTIEGLLAKARWIADKPRTGLYLNPLFRDLCAAIPSEIPVALDDDQALRDAVAAFRDVDFQQAVLCANHDCDCDDIPGYAATEALWRPSVDAIANLPAQSWAGIVAKAEVIKAQSVWHDRDLSESIGDSIAEDVLRLAGRTWDPKVTRVQSAAPAPVTTVTRAA